MNIFYKKILFYILVVILIILSFFIFIPVVPDGYHDTDPMGYGNGLAAAIEDEILPVLRIIFIVVLVIATFLGISIYKKKNI